MMWLLRGHRLLGIVMVLPLAAWAVTGAIFFIKPGYGDAYAPLAVKIYPLESTTSIEPDPAWLGYRVTRTVLGIHLLAETAEGRLHLRAENNELWSPPTGDALKQLVQDATMANPKRYGQIIAVKDGVVETDTGVRISLNWQSLRFSQRGQDTDRIDWYYKVHYLQWTGNASFDRILGMAGLVLLVLLALSGSWLFAKGGRGRDRSRRPES